MIEESANQYTQLLRLIGEHFDHAELITLCFDLCIPERNLRHDTDELLIIDVIKHCYQKSHVANLIEYCHKKRPKLNWPDPETIKWVDDFDPTGPRFPLIQLPPANPNFTSRDELLNTIQASFNNQQSAIAITQAIAGLGGVGKTQLALAYAHAHRDDYDLIWWLNAESEPALAEALTMLSRALHLPVDTLDRPATIGAVLTWITSTDKRWLLVYDNVDNLTSRDLRPFLPGGTGHTLITSRNPNWRGLAQVLDVKVFTPEESVTFLRKRLGEGGGLPAADASWEALAKELGYLPLALEHAAAYMEVRDKTAVQYLDLFQQRRQELWARAEAPDAYHATITTTWDLAFAHAQHTLGAAALLNLCCFLAPDDIPLTTIQALSWALPAELAAVLADELALDDALAALTHYSLLTKTDDTLAIHRLVQTVARDQMEAAQAKKWIEAAVGLLRNAYHFNQHDMTTWPVCGQLLPHVIAVVSLADGLNITTNHTASLNSSIGLYLKKHGNLTEALPYYERALTIREQLLGSNHPDTAISLNNLGHLLQAMGYLAEAGSFYERALGIAEQILGPDHPDTANSLNNLGYLLQAMGNLAEARPYYERALDIREQILGPDHPDTAISLNNLGALLQAMGNKVEAISYYGRALDINMQVLGPYHPDTGVSFNNLGYLLHDMGYLAEAKPFYERALDIVEQVFGSYHPTTASSLNNLGFLLRDMGNLAEAHPYLERGLAIREQVLGSVHPNTAQSFNNLGLLLRDMGNLAEARPYLERALAIREQVLGSVHPDTAQSINNLGSLLQDMGNLVEARPYLERAMEITVQTLGPEHYNLAYSLNNLAMLAQAEGDLNAAREYLQRALTIFEIALGSNHQSTQIVRENLKSLSNT